MAYDYMEKLREFHTKFGHHTQSYPEIPPDNVIELREKLIREESEEYSGHSFDLQVTKAAGMMVSIADDLADILYVVFGTALAYGIPIDEVFDEVHRSNMTKSMLKDEKAIPGKTLKGPDWVPPNIMPILIQAREREGK